VEVIAVKLAAVLFGFVAMWCVLRIVCAEREAPTGTLWPDGEAEKPVTESTSDVSSLPILMREPPTYPLRLTDHEMRVMAERYVGVKRGR
jgi:hypothetical protein